MSGVTSSSKRPADTAEDRMGAADGSGVQLGVALQQLGSRRTGVVAEEQHDLSTPRGEAGVARGPGAAYRLGQCAQGEREPFLQGLERLEGAIGGAVVDDHHLGFHAAESLLGERRQRPPQGRQAIAGGDDHRQVHISVPGHEAGCDLRG